MMIPAKAPVLRLAGPIPKACGGDGGGGGGGAGGDGYGGGEGGDGGPATTAPECGFHLA